MCRVEAPRLTKFAEQYKKDGLVVLGIIADDYEPDKVEALTKKLGLKHDVLLFGSDVASKYSLKRWPSNVYVDRKGRIVDHDFGYAEPAVIEKKLKRYLKR